MNRLTKTIEFSDNSETYDISNELLSLNADRTVKVKLVLQKLAEYENLEENEKLIKLPCKVGDTIWDNDCGIPCAYTITAFSFGECGSYIDEPVTLKEMLFYYSNSNGSITGSFAESEIGKTIFLTKSEAYEKLKELRDDNNGSME